MNYRTISKISLNISEISLGTWEVGGKWEQGGKVRDIGSFSHDKYLYL